MSDATNSAVKKYEEFISVVEERFAIAHGQRKFLATTNLAKELAPAFDWEWPQAYHLINSYLNHRTDVFTKQGPKGGVGLKEWQEVKSEV